MRKIAAVMIFCGMLLLVARTFAVEPEADAILGQWYTEGDESIVEIYKSGECYCGKIIWLKEPTNSDGSEKVDANNPDESKRGRKVLGIDILSGFKYESKGAWGSGRIYDPNNGKTYSCNARLKKGKLNIRGYIGVSLLGRTTMWRQADAEAAAESSQ